MKRRHYDQSVNKFGELHRSTVAAATGLASAFAKTGDEIKAIMWLEMALENGRQIDPEDDPNLLNTKQGLAYYYYKNGKKTESLKLYLDIFDNGYESTGFQTSRVKNALQLAIVIQQELRKPNEAIELAKRFFELVGELEEPARHLVVGANAAMAVSHYDVGNFDEALTFADSATNVELTGAGFPRGVVRSKIIRALILLQDDIESASGEQLLAAAFRELEMELPSLQPMTRWMVSRSCERAIEVYSAARKSNRVTAWSVKLKVVLEIIGQFDHPR